MLCLQYALTVVCVSARDCYELSCVLRSTWICMIDKRACTCAIQSLCSLCVNLFDFVVSDRVSCIGASRVYLCVCNG